MSETVAQPEIIILDGPEETKKDENVETAGTIKEAEVPVAEAAAKAEVPPKKKKKKEKTICIDKGNPCFPNRPVNNGMLVIQLEKELSAPEKKIYQNFIQLQQTLPDYAALPSKKRRNKFLFKKKFDWLVELERKREKVPPEVIAAKAAKKEAKAAMKNLKSITVLGTAASATPLVAPNTNGKSKNQKIKSNSGFRKHLDTVDPTPGVFQGSLMDLPPPERRFFPNPRDFLNLVPAQPHVTVSYGRAGYQNPRDPSNQWNDRSWTSDHQQPKPQSTYAAFLTSSYSEPPQSSSYYPPSDVGPAPIPSPFPQQQHQPYSTFPSSSSSSMNHFKPAEPSLYSQMFPPSNPLPVAPEASSFYSFPHAPQPQPFDHFEQQRETEETMRQIAEVERKLQQNQMDYEREARLQMEMIERQNREERERERYGRRHRSRSRSHERDRRRSRDDGHHRSSRSYHHYEDSRHPPRRERHEIKIEEGRSRRMPPGPVRNGEDRYSTENRYGRIQDAAPSHRSRYTVDSYKY